jgi:hypothetical protein
LLHHPDQVARPTLGGEVVRHLDVEGDDPLLTGQAGARLIVARDESERVLTREE